MSRQPVPERAPARAPSSTAAPASAVWSVLVLVAYVAMVAVNALANALPFFGNTTAEVSGRYPTLFTPAPFTFGVWGVIYLLLGAFAVYQLLPRQRGSARLARARPLFVLSCFLNVGWLVSWHGDVIWLSEVLMVALLATLIAVYRRVGAWRAAATAGERWLVDVPLSVYLGWISVATIANTSIFLVSLGVDGGRAAAAITVAVVALAAALGVAATVTRRDAAFAAVVGWGLVGVAAGRSGEAPGVTAAAAAAAALLGLAAVWALARRSRGEAGRRPA